MFSRLTVRLLIILSLITILVMSMFVVVRFNAASELMQTNLQERSTSVAERVANSVRPTIWNIYKKVYDRNYSVELASAILDSEMKSPFVVGIKVFGNFGHLYMGRIKLDGEIVQFDPNLHSNIWLAQKNRIRFPIKTGEISIGNVEVSYSDELFTQGLYHNLIVEIAQVAVIGFLFVGSLYLVLRYALVSPMQSLQIAQQALDSLDEAVFVTDSEGRIIEINPAYSAISLYSEHELIGNIPAIFPYEESDDLTPLMQDKSYLSKGYWAGEVVGYKKDGSSFPGWLNVNKVQRSDNTVSYVGVLADIEEKKAAEEKLHNLAYYDSLTEIPNRHAFILRLDEDIKAAKRHNSNVGLLYLDLDNFKWANDQFGHAVGDKLLAVVATQFKDRLRDADVIYRIGGDEFTVIVNDYDDASDLVTIANNLVDVASKAFVIDGHSINVGASVGISTYPDDSDNAKDLIIQADTAMYQAKEAGRGKIHFFSQALEEQRQSQQHIEQQLKQAISTDQLQLFYQPKAELIDQGLTFSSAEALIRWHEDDKPVYTPDQFIEVAEKSNLICELGYWVIKQACTQIHFWKRRDIRIKVAINLSPRQLRDESLFQFLLKQMKAYDVDPELIELEITEHAVIDNIEQSIATLLKLKSLGITIAMDDFGTGYSSLSYLKQLPIDVLKIDRSFVHTLPFEQGDTAIVTAIFSMAEALKLKVVAEGVENEQQLQFLQDHNCDMAQGYYFAPALESKAFIEWLNLHKR